MRIPRQLLFVPIALFAARCGTDPGSVGTPSDSSTTGNDLLGINPESFDMANPQQADLGPPPPGLIVPVAGVSVTTLAGSSVPGAQDGIGAAAHFENPVGVALTATSDLYVTEYDGARVRKLTRDGKSSLLTSQKGMVGCFAVMVAAPDHLIVQTDFDMTGVKNDSSGTLWTVSTATGIAVPVLAGMGRPRGLAAGTGSDILIADTRRHTVSRWASGSQQMTGIAGATDISGDIDGAGASARFSSPLGVTRLSDGSLLVADSGNHCVRRVAPDGTVSTFAGDGVRGLNDGPRATARFDRPIALASDSAGNVYVSDQGSNHRIRRILANGGVDTFAGNGVAGFADGQGPDAAFYGQEGMALEVTTTNTIVYLADGNAGDGTNYHRIRKLTGPIP